MVDRQPSRQARDREAFFTAAYELLGERGPAGLTVAALCARVGVSKGSFYHHFADMSDFLAAFAQRWRLRFVDLFDSLAAHTDLRRLLEASANSYTATMSPGVRAVLSWARTNPVLADAAAGVFASLQALSTGCFAAMAGDEDTGAVIGPMVNSMAIGIQARPQRFPPQRFLLWCSHMFRAMGAGNGILRVDGRPYLQVHSWRPLHPVSTSPTEVSRRLLHTESGALAPVWAELGGKHGVRGRYFSTAGELLAEHGPGGLSVAAMVERLELTKGSFHHHFGALPTFVEELAAQWEQAQRDRLEGCLAERNAWRRLERLHADLLTGPGMAETAWRAWAHSNTVVANAVRRVDDDRERALALTLRAILDTGDENVLAEMTYGFALGLHGWYPPLDPTLAARASIEWMRLMVGIDAEVRNDSGVPMLALRAA
ncbi:MAG TPA: TetR/AcrR family transcriptional regulator [Sporichthyaceae bacterium]|jgi:AcrR family transcriptional regulator